MDAYLTEEARRSLEALALLGGTRGYIIGHRRGPRFFVESFAPSAGSRAFSGEDLRHLEHVLGAGVIGFFAVGPGRAAAKKETLQPFGCGKLFLEARPRRGQSFELRAFAVEFDGKFRHEPVPLAPVPERNGS
jgi:hypothetical protein